MNENKKQLDPNSDWELTLNNEFAVIKLSLDHQANGVRLRIESVVTSRVVYLDPIQLDALTWIDEEVFTRAFETPFGSDLA